MTHGSGREYVIRLFSGSQVVGELFLDLFCALGSKSGSFGFECWFLFCMLIVQNNKLEQSSITQS